MSAAPAERRTPSRRFVGLVLILSGIAAGLLVMPANPPPTFANVRYGPYPRQTLDFWRAETPDPAPVVVCVHGGAWLNGDKSQYHPAVGEYLRAGISVASINYRFVWQAAAEGVSPPVAAPMADAARAVQFLRWKAGAWHLDPARIGATGESAGGCTVLWLAFHDDLANPDSPDPIARQSTRLACAAVDRAQTTLDPLTLRDWIPNATYGGHDFGLHFRYMDADGFETFQKRRVEFLPDIQEYSPITHVSPDDPPVFLEYPTQKTPPMKGRPQRDPTHSALYGIMLMEKIRAVGAEGILTYPGHTHDSRRSCTDFIIDRLTRPIGRGGIRTARDFR